MSGQAGYFSQIGVNQTRKVMSNPVFNSKDCHSFSVAIASQVGIHAAIIIQHLAYLHTVNRQNENCIIGNRVWIKKTVAAFCEVYPYMTTKEIRGAVDRLERDSYLMSGVISESNLDRSKSYSFSDAGFDLVGMPPAQRLPNPRFAKRANAFVQKGKSHLSKRANDIKVSYSSYTLSGENFDDFDAEGKKEILAAGAAENSAAGAGDGFEMLQKIPAADSPAELVSQLREFYRVFPDEWHTGVLQFSKKTNRNHKPARLYGPDKIRKKWKHNPLTKETDTARRKIRRHFPNTFSERYSRRP